MIKPILYCGLALTLLSALGFVLMIWSPGAVNMAIGCGVAALVYWVALFLAWLWVEVFER